MKHTPGPWKVRKVPAGNWFIEAELKHNKGEVMSQIFVVPKVPYLRSAALKKGIVTVEMAYSSWYQFEMSDWNEEAWEGNAHLMAAAPDLLVACEKMESFINNLPDGGDYELVEEAQQAIRKAEGNEK